MVSAAPASDAVRPKQTFLAIVFYVVVGLIVAGFAIWVFVSDFASQNEQDRIKQADIAAREKLHAEIYAVPAALKGLKLRRPRTGPMLEKPSPVGKLVAIFDPSEGQQFLDDYREMILGSDIGLSPYHAYLLPNRRADTKGDVSAVLWLCVYHKYDDSTFIVNRAGTVTGTLVEERLVIDAVVTDLEGNTWVGPVHETLQFGENDVYSRQTREEALAKFGAAPKRVVQFLREKLGMEIWQATLPDLDFDRHNLWVDPSKSFKERQAGLAD